MKHMLVIDDDVETRHYLMALLTDEGYSVQEVGDGHEGLAFLRGAPYAYVVLLDYLMPNFNGFDVLRAAFGEPGMFQRHRFIIMTSLPGRIVPPELAVFMTNRDIPLLHKPFDFDDVLQAVEDSWQHLL
ncbi:MAG: response regulator [Ktedonobacterales bacterium]|nr:response regulator [Ktedonobacterales bacterium]